MKNIFKENEILYRKNDDVVIFKYSNVDVSNILDLIEDYNTYRDHMLHFKSGVSADWVREQAVAGDLSKNILGIYDSNMYTILMKIKKLLIEACNKYEINIEKSKYYISSEHESYQLKDAWYDFGGIRIPCFSGMVFLKTDGSKITVGNESIIPSEGDILLFEAGHKITYGSESFNMISFSIAPLSMLVGQYPQKWIPILGEKC